MAVRFSKEDRDYQYEVVKNINEHILLICKGLGMKEKNKKNIETKVPNGELLPLNEMLAILGGQGVVLE